MNELRAGDAGTIINFTVRDENNAPVDLAAATTKEVVVVGPNQASSTAYPAHFVTDGTDGQLQLVTTATTFSSSGTWRLQVHVVLPAGEWRSTVERLIVEPAL